MGSGAVEAVVVVPLEGGAFGLAVLHQVVDVGFAPARLEQELIAGFAGGEALRDAAEGGERLALGQPSRVAVELGAAVGAVKVNGKLARLLPQLVVEGDAGALAGAAADRRPREAAAEGPEPGLGPGEDLLLGLADRDPDVVLAEDRRDRQPRAKGGRRQRRRRTGAQRQRAAAPPPQGKEDGKRTAAEGAEESSAPEAAVRC
jgi:hypothetical protein